MAILSGLPPEQMGLGHAFEINPVLEDGLLWEIAQAQLARQIFPDAPLKYMPPTKHMTGNIFKGYIQDALWWNIKMYNTEEDNFKIMETIKEKEEFIDVFFKVIVGDYFFIECLNRFKNKKGFGIESLGILFYQSFDEWDKYRCKENEIALMDYPAPDQDRIGYLGLQQFYPYVYQHGQKYIQKRPEKEEEVTRLLKEIKENWGV